MLSCQVGVPEKANRSDEVSNVAASQSTITITPTNSLDESSAWPGPPRPKTDNLLSLLIKLIKKGVDTCELSHRNKIFVNIKLRGKKQMAI